MLKRDKNFQATYATDFIFDDDGELILIPAKNRSPGSGECEYNLRLLDEMYGNFSPRGRSGQARNYEIARMPGVGAMEGVFLWKRIATDGSPTFLSYSQAIELIMGVWDSKYGVPGDPKERYVCELSD
jgi:hypothetical protein